VHPRASVSAVSTWTWDLDEDLAWWTAAGIHTVGVALRKLDAAGLDAGARRVAGAGLRVASVLGLGPFALDDPRTWPAGRDRLRRAIEAAAVMDAGCLVLTTGPAGALPWEQAADALADALGPCLSVAAGAGVAVALEHTNALRVDVSFLHTLRDAVDLSRRLDVGVCLEVNACWAERGLAHTIAGGADRLRLVQVSDFSAGTHATPDRRVPGDGDIPLRRLLGHVLDAGYEGVFDLELVGPRIEAEGYRSAVPRALAALDELLRSLGA
jgi:sugar phosphate isomerase/epimerase